MLALIIVLVAVAVLAATGIISMPGFKKFLDKDKSIEAENLSSISENNKKPKPLNLEFYKVARARAIEWKEDAVLASLDTDYLENKEALRKWKLTFVSKNYSKGLLVYMSDNTMLSTQEIPYYESGAELSSEIITPEEAARRVREMPGYGDVPISKVNAIYGSGTEVWYWGVHTLKGVVSVKARN